MFKCVRRNNWISFSQLLHKKIVIVASKNSQHPEYFETIPKLLTKSSNNKDVLSVNLFYNGKPCCLCKSKQNVKCGLLCSHCLFKLFNSKFAISSS